MAWVTADEITITTQLPKGHMMMEVQGKENSVAELDPEPLVPLEPRLLSDHVTSNNVTPLKAYLYVLTSIFAPSISS